jgi:hypothetical protein
VVTRHRKARLRSLIAGKPMCRCLAWLDQCPVLNPPTVKPAPQWDGPTVFVSEAPLLTRGQAWLVREPHDLD